MYTDEDQDTIISVSGVSYEQPIHAGNVYTSNFLI